MKIMKLVITSILLVSSLFLCACTSDEVKHEGIKVTYELEGGTYQNSQYPVSVYYQFANEEPHTIKPLTDLLNQEIEKPGYRIEGYYTEKIVEGDTISYQNRWDFSTNTVGEEGVTLYVNWIYPVEYTYDVCYLDDAGEKVILGSYKVDSGGAFKDTKNLAKKRTGYTPIDFLDENGDLWDDTFTHPGGETSLAISVYVKYIEGNYKVIKKASDLQLALKDNIYLYQDIDMNGASLSFQNYGKAFIGNGHTISNFVMGYSSMNDALIPDYLDSESNIKVLSISIFGDCNGASIADVNFTDVLLDIDTINSFVSKIYVAPLSVKSINSTFTNIHFEAKYQITNLPSDFSETDIIIETENLTHFKDATVTSSNNTVIFQKITNGGNE